ncbi:MAG: D-Ala-D-Ala carboxypeptidase family metallohydrolase [Dokdonella sp.]|uniref:D-Ala-D-Ala carboxypeptidase family metallohydrolase n=1 Tax=Dokdonella sp. TaxID=2291710 RepID=UPI003F7FF3CC
MTPLTTHFSLDELVFSSTAQRLGIDNTPTASVRANLLTLALGLEQVRALLGAPLHIDSGYRCPALNQAVGGVANSAHLSGFAADFVCADYGSPLQIARAIAGSGIAFDQVIMECESWVHVAFGPTLRRQALTARLVGGQMTYVPGV